MDLITTLFIAVGLAMDASAVSLGIGASAQADSPRSRFRLALHFGIFQALMPVLGWLGGTTIASLIQRVDHWVAFALLVYVGGRMIRAGLNPEQESYPCDPSRGKTLVMLSIATSIDALAVGLSLAMLEVSIVTPALIIGMVTFAMSMAGLLLGNRLGHAFGKRMEVVGGLVLIGIGLRIVIEHTLL